MWKTGVTNLSLPLIRPPFVIAAAARFYLLKTNYQIHQHTRRSVCAVEGKMDDLERTVFQLQPPKDAVRVPESGWCDLCSRWCSKRSTPQKYRSGNSCPVARLEIISSAMGPINLCEFKTKKPKWKQQMKNHWVGNLKSASSHSCFVAFSPVFFLG